MPGTFSKASRPRRPGAYVNFEITEPVALPASQGSVVAIPFTHDWGPFEEAVELTSFGDFQAQYGTSDDTPGYRAVLGAFKGEGLPGQGGAGAVLAYRFGGASAAKAGRVLQNTTPAAAVTLTAKYEGTRGNDLRITVQDNAADAAQDELIVLDGTTELERYSYVQANLADLVATINDQSRWVTATLTLDGVALAAVSAVALTGGDDGSTVLAADWTAVMSALEAQRFGVLGTDLIDTAILASLVTWAKNQNAAGHRFMTVVGGGAADTIATAISRSGTINDPNFLNLGGSQVEDDDLGLLSTAQLAPRVAGILANRGEGRSLTYARLAGISRIVAGATTAEIEDAFDGGVTVLSRDTQATAPVKVEKGLTTYTDDTTDRPLNVFSNPKFVRTMHGIENGFVELAERPGIIGDLPVNDKTRNYLRGVLAGEILEPRVARSVLQPNPTVDVDIDPPPSDDDEFVAFRIGLKFSRSTEQVYLTVAAG